MNCYRILPAHSDELQSWVSVELPGQVSLPPKDGSLQPRPLTLDPLPHVVEQWDHWPQDSHSAGIAAKLLDLITEQTLLQYPMVPNGIPGHSVDTQSSTSVEFPGHWSLPPKAGSLQPRPRTLDPLPHVVEQGDHCPQDSHSAGMAAKLLDFIIEEDHQKWRSPLSIDNT